MPISANDMHEIISAVKENWRKINACPGHFFDGPITLGGKNTCKICGGVVDNRYLGAYVQGYMAAGGNPNDVKPGWKIDG